MICSINYSTSFKYRMKWSPIISMVVATTILMTINSRCIKSLPVNLTQFEQFVGGRPSSTEAESTALMTGGITAPPISVETQTPNARDASHTHPKQSSVSRSSQTIDDKHPSSDSSSNLPLSVKEPGSVAQGDMINRPNITDSFTDKNRGTDRITEGSGLGPPIMGKSQGQRLDDTEDSDDDDDEEDYDYKEPIETGSGNSHHKITTGKPDLIPTHSDTLKKPAFANDFYSPFRPPVSPGNSVTSQPKPEKPIIQTTTTIVPHTNAPYAPTTTIPTMKPNLSSHVPNLRMPGLPKNKTVADYDYEDEGEDDDQEEGSVFEDNDQFEGETVSNKTAEAKISAPKVISTSSRKNSTSSEKAPTTSRFNSSAIALSRPVIPPTTSASNFETDRPIKLHQPSKPTIQPGRNPSLDSGEDKDEDERENEDDEDEDEDEETLDDGIEDDTRDDIPKVKSTTTKPASVTKLTDSNQNSQTKPLITMNHNRTPNIHPYETIPTTPVSSQNYPIPVEYSTTPMPNVEAAKTSAPSPKYPLPVTQALPTSVVPISTSRNNLVAVTMTTTVRPILNFSANVAPTKPQPVASPKPIVPVYFSTLPPYASYTPYPTGRISPSGTTNIQPYDIKTPATISYNNSESLTRQIYVKAAEAYYEADKTIRSALEAVWPPNFNLDQSALEPLLAQPIFFMLALGGAIIGLVLLMMLVVYLITYQIQPKDDDISIY